MLKKERKKGRRSRMRSIKKVIGSRQDMAEGSLRAHTGDQFVRKKEEEEEEEDSNQDGHEEGQGGGPELHLAREVQKKKMVQ